MIDINNMSTKAGVYIMKDKNDEILYIGKAKNLKKRVHQYFNEKLVKKRGPKIEKMVSQINNIDFIVTNTEIEALILENNLIKEHKPKYNTLLKDDKTYPYIEITKEDYPKIQIVRKIKNNNSKYYGPFTDIAALNLTLNVLLKKFNIRQCKNLPNKTCLYFSLHQCLAPCINDCKEQYNGNIGKIKKILYGQTKDIFEDLKEKMQYYSDDLNFEKAQECKDAIESIKKITSIQRINKGIENIDIINFYKDNDNVILTVFEIKNGKLINKENYKINNDENIIYNFINQYYLNATLLPSNIIVPIYDSEYDVINDFFKENKLKCTIRTYKNGHEQKLLDLVKENAKIEVDKNYKNIEEKENKLKEQIKCLENIINKKINRIESFDISNTSGVLNVASMVVFENLKFNKNSFRKYKLETNGANDYKCMQEVITRRLKAQNLPFPDVLLIDGGIGQVNAVKAILSEYNVEIPVCGMVKNDKHRTRGLIYEDEEYDIKDCINLITQIQDRTHDFAINYHSLLRTKNMLNSELEKVKGIGKKKSNYLMKKYKTIDNILKQTDEELYENNIINKTDIKNIRNYFNK